ncbi:MAG: hypothetical protein JZU65_24425 [Chlorobium sp.]|nr:hypothetical protein [Chlorobium sp.]
MRFVTIATSDYSIHANSLIKSILCTHQDAEIIVYTDRVGHDKIMNSNNVEKRVLDEIAEYGVKRAKFFAYADASSESGFVYLDSDILVLKPLDALLSVKEFTACRDDLRECLFIPDPAHPWVNAPWLSGKNYFNSGVFAVPAGYADFFGAIKKEATDDHEWGRFTIPGKLYDNHFLCAKVAQYDIPISFISEHEYNWQGYRSSHLLECYVDDKGEIRNRTTEKLLRLVHFAGIKDIGAHIAGLPIKLAIALAESNGVNDCGIVELFNYVLNTKSGIDPRLKMIMAQAMCQSMGSSYTSPGAETAVLGLHSSIASFAHSVQQTDFLWNDLKCGSAYLSAAEYQKLRNFVTNADVRGVLEFGASYTTALFVKLGCKQVALEGCDGPCLKFARAQGADARLVPFISGTGFDDDEFVVCHEKAFSVNGKKLVFIDSHRETNLSSLVEQILRLASDADFYVMHDSIRDSAVAYRLCSALGLQVIDYFPSLRGLSFFGKPGAYSFKLPIPQRELKERVPYMRFDVLLGKKVYSGGGNLQSLFIHLNNIGEETISADTDDLEFSMHLIGDQGDMLQWDTPRYKLPADLQPGDRFSFKIDLSSYSTTGMTALFDFVKEGELWWSELAKRPCPKLIFSES